MKRNNKTTKNLRASMLESCGEIHEDDGVDPRTYFQPKRTQKENRKTRQLCQQVARTINLCLNDCDDPVVQAMFLIGVQPAPDSSCLLLHIEVDLDDFDHAVAMNAIREQTARLQFEIARSINRKRVPNLTFSVSAAGGSVER
jgi:ribosome-binding factor A